jgi:hypothetical protein
LSWLRIDDRMASHPKIAQLTDREFRIWMRLLSFCAAYQDPSVDKVALSEVNGLSPVIVTRFAALDLLDIAGDSYEIHDWTHFQPKDLTGADRQARWRARNAVRNAISDGLKVVDGGA